MNLWTFMNMEDDVRDSITPLPPAPTKDSLEFLPAIAAMKTEFTPGPWRIDEADFLNYLPEGFDHYHSLYAGNGFYDTSDKSGFGLTGFLSDADLHLIAAAPDMFNALQKIAAAWNGDTDRRTMQNALELIVEIANSEMAKARGGKA